MTLAILGFVVVVGCVALHVLEERHDRKRAAERKIADAAGESFVAVPVEVEIPDPPKPYEWTGRAFVEIGEDGEASRTLSGDGVPALYCFEASIHDGHAVEVEVTIREVVT